MSVKALLARHVDCQGYCEVWGEREAIEAIEREAARRSERVVGAARYVVQLGNQPGLDDDEWEQAFTALEEALR